MLKKEGVKIFTIEEKRICTKCGVIKPFSDFNKSDKTNIGVTSICKICVFQYRWICKNKEKILPHSKICTKCNVEKDITSFVKDASKIDGIACACKPCVNAHKTEKLKNDSIFKLSNNVRKLISSAFKTCSKGMYAKNSKTEKILKLPFLDLHLHIESQFLNWMTWDNYGNVCEHIEYSCSWDLDHIIPISSAKTEEDIYLLNHWSNFQPLCSKVNRDIKRANLYPCTNLELKITFWEDYYEYI